MKIRKLTKLEKALLFVLAMVVIAGCTAGVQAYQNQDGQQLDVRLVADAPCRLNNTAGCFQIVTLTYDDPATGLPVTDICRIWVDIYAGGLDCERLP